MLKGSVHTPPASAGMFRQYRAFAGPGLLVAVGYMDPGNWGTDLLGGAQFRYGLMWVVALASLMAVILQMLAVRLGIVTGKDLAQLSRQHYPRWTRIPNWLLAEIGIAACDLAEVLGGAVALNLLFGVQIVWAVLITATDVLLVLGLQRLGMRLIEAVVLALVATIAICFAIELFALPGTPVDLAEIGAALLRPELGQVGMATVAIGIVGATVMPHNLYLHSALVRTRELRPDEASIRQAIRWNSVDVAIALSVAFLVNAAILVLAAITFNGKVGALAHGVFYRFDPDTDWIRVAYLTLSPILGTCAASFLFAFALLAAGQSSTMTGTLAGQVVMEGFLDLRMSLWRRRLLTRLAAILPAILTILLCGGVSINAMLVWSQVVLALQLPFAMFPLLHMSSRRSIMGERRSDWRLLATGWASAMIITGMDLYSLGAVVLRVAATFNWAF